MPRALTLVLFGAMLLLAAGCSGPEKVVYHGGARFRAVSDVFEISSDEGQSWQPFFAKGVNLAIATPGHFPGELSATVEDYLRWFDALAEMRCNVVRAYTLHHPPMYAALGQWNLEHPDTPLYLVQGIWLDELEHGDYISDGTEQLDEEIHLVVDAIHGAAEIPERRGKAHGIYRHDVSRYVMAWLPGHEMDGNLVKQSNVAYAPYTLYEGTHISSPEGLPIESWVARALDHVVSYELSNYNVQRPVGWSNWPALDPISHPTETNRFAQDVVDVDFGRFLRHPPFTAGIFVSYHVYPFNPEFIIYDPGYTATVDARGQPNSYLGYLQDLKAHHQGMPLFITELGLPSSFGVAHINETAYDHGGYTEREQAENVVDLFQSVVAANAAGAVIFELIDEWFKRTWLTNPTTIPPERARFWYDVLNPEESFGILSYYPTPASLTIDGELDDWQDRGEQLVEQVAAPLAPAHDGLDDRRTLTGLWAAADPAFLFLRLDVPPESLPDLEQTVWIVGLSTLPGATGDRRLPLVDLALPANLGFEAAVVLDGAEGTFQLLTDNLYDPAPRLNGESKSGGTPTPNADGEYTLSSLIINHNEAYIAVDKPVIPEIKRYAPGLLRRGDSAKDTLSHFQLGQGTIELRLPWHALWVTDPSSHAVLDDNPDTEGFDASQSEGVRLVVVTARRTDAGLTIVDVLPRAAREESALAADRLPIFRWSAWDYLDLEERKKPLFFALQQAFGETP